MTQSVSTNPPTPLGAVPFNLPKPQISKLSNGLTVIMVKDRRNPLVTFSLATLSGDLSEPRDKVGLSSAVASLLNEGTKQFSSKEIADEIELLGTNIGASAGDNHTVLRGQTLSIFTDRVLELMVEIALQPVFPDTELALYKENTIESLKYQRSQPDFLADEQFSRAIYGDHPYGILSPNEKDISSISRQDLIAFHSNWYVPNSAMFFAFGDFDEEDLLGRLEKVFGDWEAKDLPAIEQPEIKKIENRRLIFVNRPGSSQANIVLGNLAVKRNNPDYFPIIVMNQILGSGASSRLFMNLREEKGYTYGAYSRFYMRKDAGSFEMSAEVRNDVAGATLKEFLLEAGRIRTELVSSDELQDAQNYLAGVFPIRTETQGGLSQLVVSQYLSNLPKDYLDTYRDNVRAVTVEDVRRVAEKYILPDQMVLVVVGDATEVLPQIEDFSSDISIFDAKNNPLVRDDVIIPENAEPADFSGDWELSVNAQGQHLSVTLTIEQDGRQLSGKLESMIGEGSIVEGSVKGNTFSTKIISGFQGQEIELNVTGSLVDGKLEGLVAMPVFPEPMPFTGERK